MHVDWIAIIFSGFGGVVIGGLLGGAVSYWLSKRLEGYRRNLAATDVAVSLYHEMADRAARCLQDYILPWRKFDQSNHATETMPVSRVAKFRPAEPVVYPGLAANFGLIKSEALSPIFQFYFRLDALRREIDGVVADFDADTNLMVHNKGRVTAIALRFRETLSPALNALESLNVESSERIDVEVAASYPETAKLGKPLREALRGVLEEIKSASEDR